MQDRWDDTVAAGFEGPLGQLVYASRLLGSEPELVLHGGGNTSIKATLTDITGDEVEVLYVKGSGGDLATIGPDGFAPLRQDRVRRLGELDHLTDTAMMNELRGALLDASAPNPSVETILHASLPYPAVLHTHADAVLALTDTPDDEVRLRHCFGDRVVLIAYVMPGFPLARECAKRFPEQAHGGSEGMLLRQHGLFTFGATMAEAYRRMIDLVTLAEEYAARHRATALPTPAPPLPTADPVGLAGLRRDLSAAAGAPLVVRRHTDPAVARFVARSDLADIASRGPATPDHVIRTKPVPLIGTDVASYARWYEGYVADHQSRTVDEVTPLDPAPRVVLDPQLGMLCAGRRPADADIVADLYHHTIDVIETAEALGGYQPVGQGDLFEVEYWELEQAKLARAGPPPVLTGLIALVTGAASGIGRACATALSAAGAAIVALDIDPAVLAWDGSSGIGVVADARDGAALEQALAVAAERFGGIDIVVAAAGVFGASLPIAALPPAEWRRVLDVNAGAVALLLGAAHPFLARSPVGGSVVVIGSKNVPAPGKGAAAYSASKAAVTQLARVAALEWASDRVRVNVVHPDGVFDTALWTDELVAERAAAAGLTSDQYRRRNLLGMEITSADVAAVVLALCGPTFRAVTGAQVPVDGGNERVI